MRSPPKSGSATEVLWVFLRLGCTSFGGPVAHLGYFHAEFVERRRWCDPESFAETVAVAQSLPGPASSQIAFALGLLRARFAGALAAWIGFTMPSALLMFVFALAHTQLDGRVGKSVVHGLQLVAVAIVAQAVLLMQRSLAPDARRLTIAIAAAAISLFVPASFATILAISLAALIGVALPIDPAGTLRNAPRMRVAMTRRHALIAIVVFAAVLFGLPFAAGFTRVPALTQFNAFYRSGALVFGGGHVVLPLLERAVVGPGWVDQTTFLAGYGAAQAVPGPLFTFAAFLGASLQNPATGAAPAGLAERALSSALALVAIFLPGLLLMLGFLPFWASLSQYPRFRSAIRTINSAVVGILFAALMRPVGTTALHNIADWLVAIAALAALMRWKAPPWTVVAATAVVSVVLGELGRLR